MYQTLQLPRRFPRPTSGPEWGQVNGQIRYALQRFLDVSMPEKVFDALQLLRYFAADWRSLLLQGLRLLLQDGQPHRIVKPVNKVLTVGMQVFLHPADVLAAIGHEYYLLILLHTLRL